MSRKIEPATGRRGFIKAAALAPALIPTLCATPAQALERQPDIESRAAWSAMLARLIEPVLANLAADRLKATMPVECPNGDVAERRRVTHLEALGRALCGTAPWLAADGLDSAEAHERDRLRDLAQRALVRAADPRAHDHIDFSAGPQNLVDAAFLAHAFARARAPLWDSLPQRTRARLVVSLGQTRQFTPYQSNWLLFSAMVEAFLASIGEQWLEGPIAIALDAHEQWYKGDGAYGDGPNFHWDYYNSYVIQPFLTDILDLMAPVTDRWNGLRPAIRERARRYAAVQERMVAPDGSFPVLGRSIAYRCGAFHHLAAMALRRDLPDGLAPAQARGALSAVIARTLSPADTFDANGWLRIGLCGAQPSLAERYISNGSLYLCSFAFLPLGLPPSDSFWSEPLAPFTAKAIWTGKDAPADHAI